VVVKIEKINIGVKRNGDQCGVKAGVKEPINQEMAKASAAWQYRKRNGEENNGVINENGGNQSRRKRNGGAKYQAMAKCRKAKAAREIMAK
jgi:hypothetical protein